MKIVPEYTVHIRHDGVKLQALTSCGWPHFHNLDVAPWRENLDGYAEVVWISVRAVNFEGRLVPRHRDVGLAFDDVNYA